MCDLLFFISCRIKLQFGCVYFLNIHHILTFHYGSHIVADQPHLLMVLEAGGIFVSFSSSFGSFFFFVFFFTLHVSSHLNLFKQKQEVNHKKALTSLAWFVFVDRWWHLNKIRTVHTHQRRLYRFVVEDKKHTMKVRVTWQCGLWTQRL